MNRQWLIPFALIVIVPAAVATAFAPTRLDPGIAGILFMAEISVGVITAAIWAGEPSGLRQVVGVTFITVAGVLETAWLIFYGTPRRTRPSRNRGQPEEMHREIGNTAGIQLIRTRYRLPDAGPS